MGPWLAGLYDTDRSVTRAAQESLKQAFPSEEKIISLWRLYRSSIVEFCLDAITKETVYTLSDERTTSPDDALAKHARVVGASVLVVTNIIDSYQPEKAQSHDDALNDFLAAEKVWDLASHSDAYVRRAVYRLLIAALANNEGSLDMKVISAKVLASSLHIDQIGSAFDYAKALASLTDRCPEVWTEYYTGSGKKSSARRLQQFLKKGSQSGPVEYWGQVGSIMRNIPQELFTSGPHDEAAEKEVPNATLSQSAMLQAMLSALRNRDEPWRNLAAAWSMYLEVFERVQTSLADHSTRCQFLKDFVLPIVIQYVRPSQKGSDWIVAKAHQSQLNICVKAFLLGWSGAQEILRDQWENLSEEIVEDIKTSLPEQSKDYLKSQSFVSEETSRWFGLEGGVMNEDDSESIRVLYMDTSSSMLRAAIESIKSRNGKPSGATATLVAALQFTPHLIHDNAELKSIIFQFVQEDSPDLLLSPSVPYFFTILDILQDKLDVNQIYQAGLRLLDESPESPAKSRALASLLSSPFPARVGKNEILQNLMNDILEPAMTGKESYLSLVQTALHNPAAPAGLVDSLLVTVANGLEIEDKVLGSLQVLNIAVKSNGDALKGFSTSSGGPKLLSRLLFLAEYPDEGVAGQAKALIAEIQGPMSRREGFSRGMEPIVEIIKNGLDTPTAFSLP